MLSDRQIERLPAKIEERFKSLNSDMLQLVGARIKEIGEMSPTDAHRMRVVAMINQDVSALSSQLESIASKSREEIEEIYLRVAKENYEFSETFYKERGLTYAPLEKKTQLMKYVSALVTQANDELLNMTRTAAFLVDKGGKLMPTALSTAYGDVLDKAVVAVTSGATDYQSAMRQTLRDLADSGLRTKYKPLHGAAGKTVDYASGYSRRLDTAVRQNILWGVKRCNQTIAEMTGAEFGADGYEIDYHSNPRPSHAAMGGKQYVIGRARTINGRHFSSFSTVASLLEDYGCLHFKMPIICGISEPAYTPAQLKELKERDKRIIEFEGKQYTTYEATQVQRKLETAARHAKDRQIIAKAAGDDTLMRQEQEKINLISHKYKAFSDAAELPTKAERMSVSGYRRVGVKPPKKAAKIVDNGSESGIIRNYDSDIAKQFGKAHYDGMRDLIDASPDETATAVWNRFENQIKVGDSNYSGHEHCSGSQIYVNGVRDAKGSTWEAPYQVSFHESGHAIDYLARSDSSNNNYLAGHFSSAYENGKFPNTIEKEVSDWVSSVDKKLKEKFKSHKDDLDWLHEHGYISDWNWDFYKRHGTWIGGKPKYSKSYAYKAVEKEIKALTPKAKADLSDILEGATSGKISCGFGHGASYWKQRKTGGVNDGLATEAFAEMIDSTFTNPESLATIKKYLPKSYGVFTEMMEILSKKG